MADCEQCAALDGQPAPDATARKGEQRTICEDCGNANLAHDRAVWTDDGTSYCPTCRPRRPARAEDERLNKSRNKWGQKYNKLLEKHRVTRAEMANQIQWVKDLADNLIAEEAKTSALRAENEHLRAALEWYASSEAWTVSEVEGPDGDYGKRARAAITQEVRDD